VSCKFNVSVHAASPSRYSSDVLVDVVVRKEDYPEKKIKKKVG
jgi:hypothetical protein